MPGLDALAANWFEKRRGIRPETVEAFGIYTEGRDLVIPYPDGLLKRRYSVEDDNPFGLQKEGRRFVWKDASGGPADAGQVPFLPPDFVPRERMILCEGETDTMAVWQALKDAGLLDKVGVVGLSGTGSWGAAVMGQDKYGAQIGPSRLEELFGEAKRVFVVFDNDDPYENPDGAASVERAWKAVRSALGRRARLVRLPQGPADVAEFFMSYDWAAFEVLLKKAAEPKRYYPRLDLTQDVPPVDWIVEDFAAGAEATGFIGDGGTGKSFIMASLALAVAGGDETWLGLPVKKHGPVIYVDEELSMQLALSRLNALGMEDRHRENLEYIWYAGVDLANEASHLYEEALEIEPALIILDSLSRVALGVDENSNTDMTKLIRSSLVPLARDSGAAVIFVHHTTKDKASARGASSIRNAADQAITVVEAVAGNLTTGNLNLFPSKPRREGATLQARIVGSIKDDGWVKVVNPGEDAF